MKDGGYSEKLEREMDMDFGRDNALDEINAVLDNEIMTAEQLLQEMMLSMTTQELKENWDHIKQNWDICPAFFR